MIEGEMLLRTKDGKRGGGQQKAGPAQGTPKRKRAPCVSQE